MFAWITASLIATQDVSLLEHMITQPETSKSIDIISNLLITQPESLIAKIKEEQEPEAQGDYLERVVL